MRFFFVNEVSIALYRRPNARVVYSRMRDSLLAGRMITFRSRVYISPGERVGHVRHPNGAPALFLRASVAHDGWRYPMGGSDWPGDRLLLAGD